MVGVGYLLHYADPFRLVDITFSGICACKTVEYAVQAREIRHFLLLSFLCGGGVGGSGLTEATMMFLHWPLLRWIRSNKMFIWFCEV